MMACVDSIALFFNNSLIRQLCLDKWIVDCIPTTKNHCKLKELCRTRWVERHEAYEVFIDMFIPIVCCFENIVKSPPECCLSPSFLSLLALYLLNKC